MISDNDHKEKKKPRVIHAIWWVPHYRSAVFRQLSQNPNYNFTVYAGNNTEIIGGAKIASAADTGMLDGISWKHVDSTHIKGPFFKGWEWQPETIKAVLKGEADVVIGLGISVG